MFAARHEQSSSDEEEADKSFSSFMKIVNSERTEDMVKMERELTNATACVYNNSYILIIIVHYCFFLLYF